MADKPHICTQQSCQKGWIVFPTIDYIKVPTCRLNQKSWLFLEQYADFNLVHEHFGGWADLTICQSGAGP